MTHSLTKISLTPIQIREIVACHFGQEIRLQSIEELKEGFFYTAYHLILEGGQQVVLKVAPPPAVRLLRYEAGLMEVEVEVMQLVRERTEVPVPEVLCYDPSLLLLPNEFFIMAFVPGVPLHKQRSSFSQAIQDGIDVEIGRFVRQMNEITGPAFGYFSTLQPRFEKWSQAFKLMFLDVLQDGQEIGVGLPVSYSAMAELVERCLPLLDEVVTPRLVHWDLWDGNIFVDPGTGKILGVIDFERALWGDPLMETNFGFSPVDGKFMQGYGQPMLVEPGQRMRRWLYDLYLYAIMVIECTYRQYPTPDQENWSRQRLAETWEKIIASSIL